MTPREPWQEQAICPSVDPEIFHVDKGGSTRAAKRVCFRCPVRLDCLTHALKHDEKFGIWGGLSPGERERVLRGASPAQFSRCRNGHELPVEGIDSNGNCRRCVSERADRERVRAQRIRDEERKEIA